MTTGSNTKTDYYAFGMAIQGRKYTSSSSYRYGFNGYGVGLNEAEALVSGVSVYPNPATDVLNIELVDATPNNKPITVIITDAFGQVVLQEQFTSQHSVLNIQHLQVGIYFYQILSANKLIKANKIVIIK